MTSISAFLILTAVLLVGYNCGDEHNVRPCGDKFHSVFRKVCSAVKKRPEFQNQIPAFSMNQNEIEELCCKETNCSLKFLESQCHDKGMMEITNFSFITRSLFAGNNAPENTEIPRSCSCEHFANKLVKPLTADLTKLAIYYKIELTSLSQRYNMKPLHYPMPQGAQDPIRPVSNQSLKHFPSKRLRELACPKWPYFNRNGIDTFYFIRRESKLPPQRIATCAKELLSLLPSISQIQTMKSRPKSTYRLLQQFEEKEPKLVVFPPVQTIAKGPCSERVCNLAKPRQNWMEVKKKQLEEQKKIYTISPSALKAIPSTRIIALSKSKHQKYSKITKKKMQPSPVMVEQKSKIDFGKTKKELPLRMKQSEVENLVATAQQYKVTSDHLVEIEGRAKCDTKVRSKLQRKHGMDISDEWTKLGAHEKATIKKHLPVWISEDSSKLPTVERHTNKHQTIVKDDSSTIPRSRLSEYPKVVSGVLPPEITEKKHVKMPSILTNGKITDSKISKDNIDSVLPSVGAITESTRMDDTMKKAKDLSLSPKQEDIMPFATKERMLLETPTLEQRDEVEAKDTGLPSLIDKHSTAAARKSLKNLDVTATATSTVETKHGILTTHDSTAEEIIPFTLPPLSREEVNIKKSTDISRRGDEVASQVANGDLNIIERKMSIIVKSSIPLSIKRGDITSIENMQTNKIERKEQIVSLPSILGYVNVQSIRKSGNESMPEKEFIDKDVGSSMYLTELLDISKIKSKESEDKHTESTLKSSVKGTTKTEFTDDKDVDSVKYPRGSLDTSKRISKGSENIHLKSMQKNGIKGMTEEESTDDKDVDSVKHPSSSVDTSKKISKGSEDIHLKSMQKSGIKDMTEEESIDDKDVDSVKYHNGSIETSKLASQAGEDINSQVKISEKARESYIDDKNVDPMRYSTSFLDASKSKSKGGEDINVLPTVKHVQKGMMEKEIIDDKYEDVDLMKHPRDSLEISKSKSKKSEDTDVLSIRKSSEKVMTENEFIDDKYKDIDSMKHPSDLFATSKPNSKISEDLTIQPIEKKDETTTKESIGDKDMDSMKHVSDSFAIAKSKSEESADLTIQSTKKGGETIPKELIGDEDMDSMKYPSDSFAVSKSKSKGSGDMIKLTQKSSEKITKEFIDDKDMDLMTYFSGSVDISKVKDEKDMKVQSLHKSSEKVLTREEFIDDVSKAMDSVGYLSNSLDASKTRSGKSNLRPICKSDEKAITEKEFTADKELDSMKYRHILTASLKSKRKVKGTFANKISKKPVRIPDSMLIGIIRTGGRGRKIPYCKSKERVSSKYLDKSIIDVPKRKLTKTRSKQDTFGSDTFDSSKEFYHLEKYIPPRVDSKIYFPTEEEREEKKPSSGDMKYIATTSDNNDYAIEEISSAVENEEESLMQGITISTSFSAVKKRKTKEYHAYVCRTLYGEEEAIPESIEEQQNFHHIEEEEDLMIPRGMSYDQQRLSYLIAPTKRSIPPYREILMYGLRKKDSEDTNDVSYFTTPQNSK